MSLLVFTREHFPSRGVQTNNLMWSCPAADLNDDCKTSNRVVGAVTLVRGDLNFEHKQRRKDPSLAGDTQRFPIQCFIIKNFQGPF